MSLQLLPCEQRDGLRLAQIENAAYATNVFTAVFFPVPMPDNAIEFRGKQLAQQIESDTAGHWWKVVDTTVEGDESIIGFALWQLYENGRPSDRTQRQWNAPFMNSEACDAVFGGIDRVKERLFNSRPHVYLSLLQVLPTYQRRGIGRMLMQWGLDQSERSGIPACLVASEAGHRLYQNCGFRDLEEIRVDTTEWGGPGVHVSVAMERECKLP